MRKLRTVFCIVSTLAVLTNFCACDCQTLKTYIPGLACSQGSGGNGNGSGGSGTNGTGGSGGGGSTGGNAEDEGRAPAAPIFPDPGDGQPNVPLERAANGERAIIKMYWWAPVGATRYVVEISRSPSFPESSTETWGTSSNDLTFIITNQQYRYATKYYWRVTAMNSFGSATSSTWTFTTEQE